MTTVKLEVNEDVGRVLLERATAAGMTLDEYLTDRLQLHPVGRAPSASELSDEEFDRVLDELAAELPDHATLPVTFSRADIYSDHD
jgi:hypothetical protein